MRRRPASRRPRQGQDGFMLVEMLVAMAVGAFLLVALASVTGFLMRSHDRITRGIQDAEDAGRALAALSREIRQAQPVHWAGKKAAYVFAGTPGQLLFAREAEGDGPRRLDAVRLDVRSDAGRTAIVRSESVLPPDAVAPENLSWQPPAPLYAGSARVAFAYYMRLDGGGEALLDAWPAGDEMPVALRMSFLPSGPNARLLSLRIPLPIDGTPGCAIRDCRANPEETEDGDEAPASPVDADDPLGWGRYAR